MPNTCISGTDWKKGSPPEVHICTYLLNNILSFYTEEKDLPSEQIMSFKQQKQTPPTKNGVLNGTDSIHSIIQQEQVLL